MAAIPREPGLDHTLALLSEGYLFIPNRVRRFQSDIFETRLMFSPVICLHGAEAAGEFYAPDRFTRQGAMPPTTLRLLQGQGSVQSLDGLAHRWRKRMFLDIVRPEAVERLVEAFEAEWHARVPRWEGQDQVVLFPEVEDLLTRAVCRWAGCPLTEDEAPQRAEEFSAMISGAGAIGPRFVHGLRLRRRTERWAADLIEGTREERVMPPPDSALAIIARHRGEDDRLLDTRVAVLELLNILRPTVAVGRFIVFAALALHDHPHSRDLAASGDDADLECFAQEVRRFYPFFPFVGGRVLQPFEWRGHQFKEKDWVILDLYGTNHDPRLWEEPESFRPERFRDWSGDPDTFIPQGAGDHASGHRCPGERTTIELMKRASALLATLDYEVPAQNLCVDLAHLPAEPESRYVMTKVRRRG